MVLHMQIKLLNGLHLTSFNSRGKREPVTLIWWNSALM